MSYFQTFFSNFQEEKLYISHVCVFVACVVVMWDTREIDPCEKKVFYSMWLLGLQKWLQNCQQWVLSLTLRSGNTQSSEGHCTSWPLNTVEHMASTVLCTPSQLQKMNSLAPYNYTFWSSAFMISRMYLYSLVLEM